MAKRFTDSEKFRDPWYRGLSPKNKCLWEFMLAECSIAGILELDLPSMSFHIGEQITENDLKAFKDRIVFLTAEKIFIPKFIKFQQNELSRTNPAHKNIFKILEQYGIDETITLSGVKSPFEGALEGLQSPISRGNGIGNGSGNIRDEEKNYNYSLLPLESDNPTTTEKKIKHDKKGSRLPDGWEPNEATEKWCMEFAKEKNVKFEFLRGQLDRFRDYWAAKAGKDGVKLDWEATFKNWVRRSVEGF